MGMSQVAPGPVYAGGGRIISGGRERRCIISQGIDSLENLDGASNRKKWLARFESNAKLMAAAEAVARDALGLLEERGDVAGHDFHGNQHTGGIGGGGKDSSGSKTGSSVDSTRGPIKNFGGEQWKSYMNGYDHLVTDGNGGYKFDATMRARIDGRVAAVTAGVPSHVPGERTAYLMGGGGGSGKSSAMDDPAMGIPNAREAVAINPDAEKMAQPEYQAAVKAGDPNAANAAHELASYIAKEQVAAARANGQNYVLDGTGDKSSESVDAKIMGGRNAGYKVIGTYVTVPIDRAITNAAVRAANPNSSDFGRVVPDSVLNNTHVSISQLLPGVVSHFDSFSLVDNTNTVKGDPAYVIAKTTLGQPLTVIDQPAYQAFLDKANVPMLMAGDKYPAGSS